MKFVQSTKSEENVKLDLKDKKILHLLGKNARTPLTRIAKQVGLSRDGVKYRIRNLETNGVIQGYITLVDIKKFKYDSYHLFLNLNHPTKEVEEGIINSLKAYSFVRAIIKFSGKYDFELAVIAKSVTEFDGILTKILTLCANYLQNYDILIITKNFVSNVFPKGFLKSEETERNKRKPVGKIDKKDVEILKAISNKATSPLHKIGDEVGLSADAVNYRIRKMVESGVIVKFLPVINFSSLNYNIYAILLSLNNLTEEKEKQLDRLLKTDDNILWAVKTVGRYNLLFYLCTQNTEDLHNIILKLRNHFKGDIKEYESLIAYEQYKYSYFPESLEIEDLGI